MAAYHRVYDSVTCRLAAKNRDQLRTLCSVIEYGLPFLWMKATRHYVGVCPPLCAYIHTPCPMDEGIMRVSVRLSVCIHTCMHAWVEVARCGLGA